MSAATSTQDVHMPAMREASPRPSDEAEAQTLVGQDLESQEKISKSKAAKKYLFLTSMQWCYVWLAVCVIGGIVGGTMGAIYGKGTRYGGPNKKHS